MVNAIDDSPKCAICNDLVNAASEKYESAPSNPVSFVRLTEMMDEFCADIRFEDVKGTCDKYMDHLIFDVFKALKFRVNPQIVCITSKYCSNDSDFESTKMSNEKTIPSNSMTQNGDNENSIRKKIDFAFDSAECFLCQTFVENVKKKVKKGQSKVIVNLRSQNPKQFPISQHLAVLNEMKVHTILELTFFRNQSKSC